MLPWRICSHDGFESACARSVQGIYTCCATIRNIPVTSQLAEAKSADQRVNIRMDSRFAEDMAQLLFLPAVHAHAGAWELLEAHWHDCCHAALACPSATRQALA